MDSLWTYLPLYLAGGLFLAGTFYQRRHPDSDRARRVMVALLIAAVAVCGVSTLVNMGSQILAGASGLIIPLALILALMVVTALVGASSLRPRPATTKASEIAERRSSVRFTIMLALIVALMAYGAGFLAGSFMVLVKPVLTGMNLILGSVGVVVVVGALVPWVVVKVRAARRRHAVSNGHPSSPEVVEHVMKKASAARLDETLGSYSFSPVRPLIFGALAILLILALPLVLSLVWTQLGEIDGTPGQPFDLTTVQLVSAGAALLIIWFMLIGYLLVPMLRGVKSEYLLSALSAAQRLQWAESLRTETARAHRFPSKLVDPDRSIRVLTITETGATRLEQIPAGSLLREASMPLSMDELLDSLVDDEDAALEDLTAAEQNAARVIETLLDRVGEREFDVFENEYVDEVHIVEVGPDDYRDFPEDLARDLNATS